MNNEKRVLIIGAGFGGVRAALDMAKMGLKITLVSDRKHFEYYPALYKVVTGTSPMEVCIPLSEIFSGTNVQIEEDKIVSIDPESKMAVGKSGSKYSYDLCVLSLGSEATYFNLPGLDKYSFGLKSINEALRLKKHIHLMFEQHEKNIPKEELISSLHFLVVGAGASGTELSGAIASYSKKLAKRHKIDPTLITIDLIEAAPRILPALPESISRKSERHLRRLGVNIFVNRAIMKEKIEEVFLKDMTMKTKTVIWTAGVKPNSFYQGILGISLSKRGRVEVNEFLEAKGIKDLFVIGDAAETAHSGLAQTAIFDGSFVAQVISSKMKEKIPFPYSTKEVGYVIPVGLGWAAGVWGPFKFYGIFAWWIRRIVDFRFLLSILPFKKALWAFKSGSKICESCEVCLVSEEGKE